MDEIPRIDVELSEDREPVRQKANGDTPQGRYQLPREEETAISVALYCVMFSRTYGPVRS